MLAGCGALTSPEKIHDPPVGSTPAAVTSTVTAGTSLSSTTASRPAATVPLPSGDQWVGDHVGGVRFAVPATWLVIDPSKFGGVSGLQSSPMIKDLASRMGVTPEVLITQMKGIKVMAAYPGTARVNAELTTSPMSVLPSDAALSTEIGAITGHPGTVQVVHGHNRFGDVAEAKYSLMAKGMLVPVRSELAAFVVQDQVWILNVTSTDARSADRAFNHAVETLSTW